MFLPARNASLPHVRMIQYVTAKPLLSGSTLIHDFISSLGFKLPMYFLCISFRYMVEAQPSQH